MMESNSPIVEIPLMFLWIHSRRRYHWSEKYPVCILYKTRHLILYEYRCYHAYLPLEDILSVL